MKVFVISKVNTEEFGKLVEFYNANPEGEITWVISSGGGDMSCATVFVDLINREKDRHTVIGTHCYSAGFFIFYKVKCAKKLMDGAMGMFHYPYAAMETTESNSHYYNQDIAIRKNNKQFAHKRTRKWCKEFMTKKELRKLEEPNDVYFTFRRMLEIFPGIEVIE